LFHGREHLGSDSKSGSAANTILANRAKAATACTGAQMRSTHKSVTEKGAVTGGFCYPSTIGLAKTSVIVKCQFCEDRKRMLMQSSKALDPAIQDKIGQLFSRAWRRVQQRTGRYWEKKRLRWLELLGAGGGDISSNQLRVALNNLVSFAQLPPADTTLMRAAIHEDFRTMQRLAIESLGRH
jgi:hypothetical protein